MEHHLGVGIEGDHDGLRTGLMRLLDDPVENITMPDVNPVKISDRDISIAEIGGEFLKGPENLHRIGYLSQASAFAPYHSINFVNFKFIFTLTRI